MQAVRRWDDILTLQRQYLLVRMHYGRVGRYRSAYYIVCVCKVDDDDLVLLIDLFPHTDKVVGLKSKGLENTSENEV